MHHVVSFHRLNIRLKNGISSTKAIQSKLFVPKNTYETENALFSKIKFCSTYNRHCASKS
jgi:hypothetical protein